MLITFSVNDQKVTHDLGSRTLVAGSSGEVQAYFAFDDSWEGYDCVIVFTNSNQQCKGVKPVRWDGEALDIPEQALVAGKLYVSVVGFDEDGRRKTTLKWDIQQAVTVQECGAMGSCDLLRSLAQGGNVVPTDDVATDEEVDDMLDDVFGENDENENDDTTPSEPIVGENDIATDEEIGDMLDDVFNS